MSGPTRVKIVTVRIDRVPYGGTYFVQNYMVHVEHPLFGSKAGPVGGTKPVMIAWLLLSELVREGRK